MLLFFTYANSQHKKSKDPILFFEFVLGGAREFKPKTGGLLTGLTLKHEINQHLYTVRYINYKQSELDFATGGFVVIIPLKRQKIHREIGLLYGRKWNYYDTSFSVSAGISFNSYKDKIYLKKSETIKDLSNSVGIPLEINLKFFKGRKTPFRAFFGLIPSQKPTAFGRSVGLKLVANISKHSFVGLGVTYGFGNHKNYYENN